MFSSRQLCLVRVAQFKSLSSIEKVREYHANQVVKLVDTEQDSNTDVQTIDCKR